MNNLINVTLNEKREPVVSARELHKGLEVKTEYKKWFARMAEYGFAENEDYLRVTQKCPTPGGLQNITDHVITLDMAKEIAMIQRTERGKQVRKYFIQVEKDFNSPEKTMARALLMADDKIKLLENNVEALQLELAEAQKSKSYLDVILQTTDLLTITQIAQDYGKGAAAFNKILHDLRIQRKVNGQWILYKKYMGQGYERVNTFHFEGRDGKMHSKNTTYWTQAGRKFLYDQLKKADILPVIEWEE